MSKAPGQALTSQQRQCGLGCPGKASGAESKQAQRILLAGGKANTLFPEEQQPKAVSIALRDASILISHSVHWQEKTSWENKTTLPKHRRSKALSCHV